MTVRWGVVGCGRITNNRTIPEGIVAAPNATLVATADAQVERAQATAERWGVRWHATPHDLFANPEVDAVYIAAPPYAHAELVMAAARAGKHVLCEKPMAMTPDQAVRMAQVIAEQGIVFGLGFMMRYHTCHARLKEIIDTGVIGTPVSLRARYSVWSADVTPGDFGDWQHTMRYAGGGPLFDMGCHAIDLFNYFVGEVDTVAGLSDTLIHGYETEDTCTALFRFKSGAHGFLQAFNSVPNFEGRNVLEVHGSGGTIVTQGTLSQSPLGRLILYRKHPQDAKIEAKGEVIEVTPKNMYHTEIENFSIAIETGGAYWIGAAEGIYVQRVMGAIFDSARTGMMIRL